MFSLSKAGPSSTHPAYAGVGVPAGGGSSAVEGSAPAGQRSGAGPMAAADDWMFCIGKGGGTMPAAVGPRVHATCSEDGDDMYMTGGAGGSDTDDTDELIQRAMGGDERPLWAPRTLPPGAAPHTTVTMLSSAALLRGAEGEAGGGNDWLFCLSRPQGQAQAEGGGGGPPAAAAGALPVRPMTMPVHPMMAAAAGRSGGAAQPDGALTGHPMMAAPAPGGVAWGEGPQVQQQQARASHTAEAAAAAAGAPFLRYPHGDGGGGGSGDVVVQHVTHVGAASPSSRAGVSFVNALPPPQEEFQMTYLPAQPPAAVREAATAARAARETAAAEAAAVAAAAPSEPGQPHGGGGCGDDEVVVQRVAHEGPWPSDASPVSFANALPPPQEDSQMPGRG
ncbi:hypothetical protein FOA52_008640 [Chlamydomonas sp. UWO 241]|nr:hypothetical protein FOA52_008640 [Chlamydomonas sp. UWO 241]